MRDDTNKGTSIKFGTDGWRGIIAGDFTFDNVRLCTQGVADYVKQTASTRRGLIIGYDTRFASEDFAAAAAEVTAANGIKTYLCSQATPTPVISYGTMAKEAAGAIIITASHNPAAWNGFKYKTGDGTSAPKEVIDAIEANISRILTEGKVASRPLAEALEQGLVEHTDLAPVYSEHLRELVDLEAIRRAELNIVVDSMYGAGAGYLNDLLAGGRIRIKEINSERNPLFPGIKQPEPIAANLSRLMTTVKDQKASVGLATDGDADRIGIVDEQGQFLTPLQVFALLCLYLLEVRGERGAIVKTITSTSMLDQLGEMFQVPVFETPVGFKHIAPIMMAEQALIGGEESGGYGFKGHVPERDGILAALYFLDLMIKTGKTPSALLDYLYGKVGPHHYKRLDLEFPESRRAEIVHRVEHHQPQAINGVEVARIDSNDGYLYRLVDGTWLLIRFSGTEPLLRIYAESDSQGRVEKLLEFGQQLAGV